MTLLKFPDLGPRYHIWNWTTLKRRVVNDGFPEGFYLGNNSRVWGQADCDAWLEARKQAGPPPRKAKARASVAAEDTGPEDASAARQSNPQDNDSPDLAQDLASIAHFNGGQS